MPITQNLTVMRRKALVGALSFVALMLHATSSTAAAQTELPEAHAGLASPIEGSWIFTVNLTQQGITFTAVASFAGGGVFLATGSNDRVNPVSPLYGSWKRKGPNRFNATADFFGFDPSGNPIAMLHDVMEYKLSNRDKLVGVGELWTCEVSGENCQRTLDFTVTAKRIVPEDITELSLPPE